MTPEQINLSGMGPVMERQEPRRTFIWHVFWKNMTKLSKKCKIPYFRALLTYIWANEVYTKINLYHFLTSIIP